MSALPVVQLWHFTTATKAPHCKKEMQVKAFVYYLSIIYCEANQ